MYFWVGRRRKKIHQKTKQHKQKNNKKHDDFHAERFYRRQRGLAILESTEDLLIEVQFEFGIYPSECLVQHSENPPVG